MVKLSSFVALQLFNQGRACTGRAASCWLLVPSHGNPVQAKLSGALHVIARPIRKQDVLCDATRN